jgi:hypothetical protein
MMIRVAEAPEWDKVNEGKILTPYWAAELTGVSIDSMLWLAKTLGYFPLLGYKFEAVNPE